MQELSEKPLEHRLASVSKAIDQIRAGHIVIVTDDEDRENEGDFVMSAQAATPEAVNFMITHGRGLLCLPAEKSRMRELGLGMMVEDSTALHGTAFTVTIDAKEGTTTGVSASDRAVTLRRFADSDARPEDFARPGHVSPLAAVKGGVLARPGHTEAIVDMARLAGHAPVGVLCEILSQDGSMARAPELLKIAEQHDLHFVTISDLIEYRRRKEMLVRLVEEIELPTRFGEFRMRLYEDTIDGRNHMAVFKGDLYTDAPVLVRMHSQCMTGDVFGSGRCDCGDQVEAAMGAIETEGRGAIIYLRQEGRGIGLANKIRAYKLQEEGHDTVEANHQLGFAGDMREYSAGAQILKHMGVGSVRLMTNNPAKVFGLEGYGFSVTEQVPIQIAPSATNRHYLRTKKEKLGHLLDT
ncbi:MAG: bifunctional 3,4-dihydroxy-2-butanone-4-phosphate synthase/GTP cyclohydrolase II [Candidatus Latescibacteria bacterium]|jgi:3,4-dihydroxy 2-butanone 4-phosphate synthase/GTP cyclohydrolase II|nr:bifunctional 3,4-dihydroxy-2-butanone-4-phosphate synthase/GTP cyclohydrolase II [Candidatus Latescibacterota bacterium]